jgi:hypothetical protein
VDAKKRVGHVTQVRDEAQDEIDADIHRHACQLVRRQAEPQSKHYLVQGDGYGARPADNRDQAD